MREYQTQLVEGELDPKPYKVDRVTKEGEFVARVAEYATESEAMSHHRRLDWHYSIHTRREKLWPKKS